MSTITLLVILYVNETAYTGPLAAEAIKECSVDSPKIIKFNWSKRTHQQQTNEYCNYQLLRFGKCKCSPSYPVNFSSNCIRYCLVLVFFHFLVTVDVNNTGRSVDREHLPEAGVMDAAADDVMSGGADLCRMTLSIHLSTSGRAALKACSQHWVRELQRERPHWNACVLQKLAEHQQIRGVSLQPIKS